MALEPDKAVDDLLGQRCEVCGAKLTRSEIEAGREDGRPFLCSVHGFEELPAAEQEDTSGDAA